MENKPGTESLKWLAVPLLALAWSCGDLPGGDQPDDVTTQQAALLTVYDHPTAAAVSVKEPSGATRLWVFACDTQNRLRRIKRSTTTWGIWQTVGTECSGVPTVGKWTNGTSDFVFVYTKRFDGHIWELWYPDASAAGIWGDISGGLGLGNAKGSPVIAQSDGTARVSVAVPFDGGLYTLDWYSDAWHPRQVLWNGLPVQSSSYLSAMYETDVPLLAGLGYYREADGQSGWVATRSAWSSSFNVIPNETFLSDAVPGLGSGVQNGAPFTTVTITNREGWLFFGDPTLSTWGWSQMHGCAGPGYVGGSMRNPAAGATNSLYGRSLSGGLLSALMVYTPQTPFGQCGPVFAAGEVRSAPTPVVDGQQSLWAPSPFARDVLFRGANGHLMYFRPLSSSAVDLGLVPL